jgi:hypothetical protein
MRSSLSHPWPVFGEDFRCKKCKKCLILLVGAPRFELGTPSPPDELEWFSGAVGWRVIGEKPLHRSGFSGSSRFR